MKNYSLRLLLVFFIITLGFCPMFGQFRIKTAEAEKPQWEMNVKMLSPTEGEIAIKCTVSKGTHVYGLDLPEDAGPRPTVVDFSSSIGISLVDSINTKPAPRIEFDKMFQTDLSQWDSDFMLTQKFVLSIPREKARIETKIKFMSCNNSICTPPSIIVLVRSVPEFNK